MHRKIAVKRNHRTAKKFRYNDLARVSGGKKTAKKTTRKASFYGGSTLGDSQVDTLIEMGPED